MTTSARTGSFLGKRSRPFDASTAVSTCVKATSALPEPISFMLSSEPPVTSAVAVMPDSSLARMAAETARQRIVDAAGAARRDRELLGLLGLGPRCRQHQGRGKAQEHARLHMEEPPEVSDLARVFFASMATYPKGPDWASRAAAQQMRARAIA